MSEEKLIEENQGTQTVIQRVVVDGKVTNALKYEKDLSIGVCKLYDEKGSTKEFFSWEKAGRVKHISYGEDGQPARMQVWEGNGKTIVQPDVKSKTAYAANCAENAVVSIGKFEFTLDKAGHVIATNCQVKNNV